MIQLSGLLWAMAFAFAGIGYMRGLSKEMISLSGIILALFTLFQFDPLIRENLLANVNADQRFFIQCFIFIGIVFFAYQTNALGKRTLVPGRDRDNDGRDPLQSRVLGAVIGFLNGYLIWGSIWYFMHINGYPLSPYIIQPPPGSPSAETINSLPLYVLAGGPGGTGSLLSLAVILLFIFVLVLI
jgi:hypothetical protein